MSAFSYINYLSKPGQDIVVVLLTVDYSLLLLVIPLVLTLFLVIFIHVDKYIILVLSASILRMEFVRFRCVFK